MLNLTQQQQRVICVVILLLLVGWTVKACRTAHPVRLPPAPVTE